MKSRSRSIRRSAWFLVAAAGTFGLIDMATSQQQPLQPILSQLQKSKTIYLDTPAPPDTIPLAQPDWDYFAWNTSWR
jgi:hypothetical protein